MRVHSITDMRDGPLRDLLAASAKGRRLVPVIGAGFSRDLPALNGRVPDAESLKRKLVSLLLESELIEEGEGDELRDEDFSEVVMTFFDLVFPLARDDYRSPGARQARAEFRYYLKNNFTSVSGLGESQQEFLRCGWPYLYTLNFDDAIEPWLGPDYTIIYPYSDIDPACYDQGHKSLIKLHGDAGEMVRSHGQLPRIILDVRQYLRSITDEANAPLLQWLIDDCASKDLLFIGCSLDSEQDILFAQHVGVSALTGTSAQNSLYVYYDEHPGDELPHVIRRRLRRYGIENVLRLRPEEYDEFYRLVATVCGEQMRGGVEDELDSFTGFTFHRLPPSDTDAEHIFCEPELVSYQDGKPQVTLPSFYVERSVAREVVAALRDEGPVCAVLAPRYSGMTYALLGVVDLLQRAGRTVYFFTRMRLADEAIERLAEKHDCTLVFDVDTAEPHQLERVLALGPEELAARGLQLVFAADQADRALLDRVLGEDGRPELVRTFRLERTLDGAELAEYNRKMGELLPVERRAGETFLDYALRVDDATPGTGSDALPDTSFLAKEGKDMLQAVLALALQPSMSVNMAHRLGIADELERLRRIEGPAVEMDYLSPLEVGTAGHAGAKYVSNSRYWLAKCLRTFAEAIDRDEDITDALGTVAERLREGAAPEATTGALPAPDGAATPQREALSELIG